MSSVSTQDYIAQRRGDVLTTGRLSASAREAMAVLGLNAPDCRKDHDTCIQALTATEGLDSERRLATLSEAWLADALAIEKQRPVGQQDRDRLLDAYLQTARAAYAYLFFTPRSPSDRAFEDRQTQVRDYYNYAVQQAVTRLFEQYRGRSPGPGEKVAAGPWQVLGEMSEVKLAEGRRLPHELVPASTLTFQGLRSMYRRDGFGAELVAVTARRVNDADTFKTPFSETPFPAVTAILSFPGDTLEQVMATREATLTGYDPYKRDAVQLAGTKVPLAANFTSGYGLWLARSGFATQALRNVLGSEEGIAAPHVYLLQPYDPDRRTIIMLHGLASSPEAWINMANEVLGDETLRQHYQIWQVYYPTNAPLATNNRAIREALSETMAHFDPAGGAQASRDIVVIGHSMGGVLSRLLVSSSGTVLWDALRDRGRLDDKRLEQAREEFAPILSFDAFPGITRAVFIAAPHRGTPFAENTLSRWLSNLITLPAAVVRQFAKLNRLADADGASPPESPARVPNGVDNLSEKDPYVLLTGRMPISPSVRYHSIIANDTPGVPLAESDDGLVPYRSAHLEGAQSEKVIPYSHSVQETPEAILELRRILKLQLDPQAP
ncbi:triacylglycerol lipase [Achromobacter sp. RTa]|uniref:esterase/lipase family protein n=1 Tax=Achromobacter sp. RTa TaxID=1532557 RepID=UPI001E597FBE|nr:alpha/beta fold hydrolase [Achromobacter sp. RTa]